MWFVILDFINFIVLLLLFGHCLVEPLVYYECGKLVGVYTQFQLGYNRSRGLQFEPHQGHLSTRTFTLYVCILYSVCRIDAYKEFIYFGHRSCKSLSPMSNDRKVFRRQKKKAIQFFFFLHRGGDVKRQIFSYTQTGAEIIFVQRFGHRPYTLMESILLLFCRMVNIYPTMIL